MNREFELCLEINEVETAELGEQLKRDGIIYFPIFMNSTGLENLMKEADDLLEKHGRRVNLIIPSTDNTPRKYVTVSRDNAVKYAPKISALYRNPLLHKFLSKLTGSDVIICPYEPEQIVVNRMSEINDTHGWHWDDYTYSLVLVLEAPSSTSGAQVEHIDGTSWDKSSAKVNEYLNNNAIRSLSVTTGSAYLLLGRRVMHRVSPMQEDDSRKIICFTFATENERDLKIEHGSMEDIYT